MDQHQQGREDGLRAAYDVPQVVDPARWMENLGSERDWGFSARPSQAVAGRSIGMSMGKVLGGGSSINVAVWARGHREDWDFFAERSGDAAWGYESVLGLYPAHRGLDGRA